MENKEYRVGAYIILYGHYRVNASSPQEAKELAQEKMKAGHKLTDIHDDQSAVDDVWDD